MISIRKGTAQDVDKITLFQLNMAFETENLNLNQGLVRDAVAYLIQHQQLGIYLVAKNEQNDTIGSLMITYENSRSWWMQSVYVQSHSRGQGVFRKLFNDMIEIATKNQVEKVSLYAQSNNQQAIGIYKKLGMSITTDVLYGYDFVYGQHQLPEPTHAYTFLEDQVEINQLKNILKNPFGNNRILSSKSSEGETLLYAEYFEQFSDWRFGRIIYICTLHVKQQFKRDLCCALVAFLKNKLGGLKVQAIRLIAKQDIQQLESLFPTIEKLHYYVIDKKL